MARFARISLITGVILLALSAVMAIGLGNNPLAGRTMLLIGAIIGLAALLLVSVGLNVGRRAEMERIVATGIAGSAQVVNVTQPGNNWKGVKSVLELNLIVTLP